MANFTAAGNSLALAVADRGDTVSVALSGTYAATVALQRERGSAGSGSWVTIKSWNTANTTVAFDYITKQFGESLRLYVTAFTSGTVVATLLKGNKELGAKRDSLGNSVLEFHQKGVRVKSAYDAGGGSTISKPFLIGAAVTLTVDEHAGRDLIFNVAAGVTVTLPAATGSGAVFRFRVGVTVTSVNDLIQVANSTDVIQGFLLAADDTGTPAPLVWVAAASSDTITLNGGSKGGVVGDYIEITDILAGIFTCNGNIKQSGTEATPFSAAV